jgi:hypothetical protein
MRKLVGIKRRIDDRNINRTTWLPVKGYVLTRRLIAPKNLTHAFRRARDEIPPFLD